MARKSGLGKGLDSLIPDSGTKLTSRKRANEVSTEIKEVIKEVPTEIKLKVSEIEPNREQPRKHFDEDALIELSESIKQVGLIQPIVVQKHEDYYEIIAGERRWRAAKLAGIKEVPVVIKDYNTQEIMEIALIENIQREDLNPIEEAAAYKRLIDEYSLLQDEVAKKVSKSRTTITNSMRLLKLSEKVQQMIIEELITGGHARALLGITDEEQQYIIATKIVDEKLSVRETEKLVKSLIHPKEKKEVKQDNYEIFYKDMESKLESIVGSKVLINNKKNGKGKIEIEYYSVEELERIIDLISN